MTEDERALLLEMAETLIDWDVRRRDRIIDLVRRVRPGFPPREQLMRTMAAQGTVRPAMPNIVGAFGSITAKITVEVECMRVLTAILLNHPDLITTVERAYRGLDLPEGLNRLRDALLWWACNVGPPLLADQSALHGHLIGNQLEPELEQVVAASLVPMPRCVRPGTERSEALAGWWHIFGFLNLEGLGEEIRLAERLCRQDLTADNQNRLLALKAAFNRVRESEPLPGDLPSNDRGGFW